jgi:hypothetical protein
LVDSCHATVFGNSSGKTALKAIYTAFVVAKPCFSAESGDPNAARPAKLGVFGDSHQPEAIVAPPGRYCTAANSPHSLWRYNAVTSGTLAIADRFLLNAIGELVMTGFRTIGAAALAIALAAASPAMARGGHGGGGGGHFGGGAHFGGGGAHFAVGGFHGGGFHGGGFRRGGGGWGPGLAVGAIAGAAALGGLGYYGGYYGPGYDSYAYDNGAYDNGYGYYDNSGYSCQPGTYFRGQDGRRYLCQ